MSISFSAEAILLPFFKPAGKFFADTVAPPTFPTLLYSLTRPTPFVLFCS